MDPSTTFFLAIAGLILISVVTLVSTGSIIATVVVIAIMGIIIYVLLKLGFITVDLSKNVLEVGYHETAPAPAVSSSNKSSPKNIEISEVFYVGGNDYTYEESSAVCAAYGAQLASYDQIASAFAAGAEWCAYGWTQGGMALFPTQESTWANLQKDAVAKTSCGRPGINGGYFDPATKFGVNCYGVKPSDAGTKFPIPPPGTDTGAFNQMVTKFKSMLKQMPVNPFNRVGWSEWNLKSPVNTVQTYV